jgi:hypothetical protein
MAEFSIDVGRSERVLRRWQALGRLNERSGGGGLTCMCRTGVKDLTEAGLSGNAIRNTTNQRRCVQDARASTFLGLISESPAALSSSSTPKVSNHSPAPSPPTDAPRALTFHLIHTAQTLSNPHRRHHHHSRALTPHTSPPSPLSAYYH